MPRTRAHPTTASPLVLVVLLWGLLWGIGAQQLESIGPGGPADLGTRVTGIASEDVWQASWSERFPGCVALALWPQDEQPRAVVTRGSGGDVARVAPEAAADAGQRGHVRVVGACR